MIEVLGMPLEGAAALLEQEGLIVRCLEVSSRKGVQGGEARVIRQRMLEGKDVELTFSRFKTFPGCESDGHKAQ